MLLYVVCSFFQGLFALDISVSVARFQSEEAPYVEFDFFVLGQTLGLDSLHQHRSCDLVLLIKSDSAIVFADRFRLIGPADGRDFNITRRYALSAGSYELEVVAKDQTDSTNVFRYFDRMVIAPKVLPNLSDIKLLREVIRDTTNHPMAKHGYLFKQLPHNFSKAGAMHLYYYLESYLEGAKAKEIYQLKIRLEESFESGPGKLVFERVKNRRVKSTDIIIGQLNTAELASGNYVLHIDLLDESGASQIVRSVFFQHSNPELVPKKGELSNRDELRFFDTMSVEELSYSLRAVAPIIPSVDIEAVNQAIRTGHRGRLLRELKYYWSAKAPDNTKVAYDAYMKMARAVDRKFQSGFGAGFETDRGYIYLKYGQPTTVFGDKQDPVAPPYEIWTYNAIPELNQTHVKFIFYNPSLAPEDYRLLHSTANGEINNPRWQLILYKNAPNDLQGNNHLDNPRVRDAFRRDAIRIFEDN